jgi:hypothetical protein
MAPSYRVDACYNLLVFLVGVVDPAAKFVQVLALRTGRAKLHVNGPKACTPAD